MPIIRDIQLLVPGDREVNWVFFKETRCIAFLYSILLPKLQTDKDKGILINCIPNMNEVNKMDRNLYTMFNYTPTFVELDVERFFALPTSLEKKKCALNVIQDGMERITEHYNWDKQQFRNIYQQIIDLDYKSVFIYTKKASPNRKYVCRVVCEHEVSHIDIYLEIKKRNGQIIRREKLFRESDTNEQNLLGDLGQLQWTLNHKVTFTDRGHRFGYVVTFIEKDTPEQLFWKIEKRSYR